MVKIRKAIVPIAGLGTRFLPLSKAFPKEFFPLESKPVIQHIVEEAIEAGVKEFIFVVSPEKIKFFKDYILKYFKQDEGLLSALKSRGKKDAIGVLGNIPKIKYKYVVQKKPLGDGDAVLKAEKLIGDKEPFLVLFGDDISFGQEGMASQLVKAFYETKKQMLCLYRLPGKNHPYGVPKIKKIKGNLYKIEDIVEKPKNPPSEFALVGKYVLTPDIFYFLSKVKKNKEILLANALKEMIKEGGEILGISVKGKWLECGNLEKWQKSFLFLAKNK